MIVAIQRIANILAQGAPEMTLIDSVSPVTADPSSFVNKFATVGLGLGTAVAVILVAIGGYTMMTSHGDAKKVQDAQDQIQNAIMGFLLILAAVAVIKIIVDALGIGSVVTIN